MIMPKLRRNYKKPLLILLAVVFLFGVAGLSHRLRRDVRITAQTTLAHLYSTPTTPFPSIATSSLTPLQQNLVSLAKQEYARKPVSYDSTVLTYTQGVSEPWCADFVSWMFKQAGQPFSNPNSGNWRIPGVYTLQAYFQSNRRYHTAGGYIPRTGDVAIYHTGEGHTNIVLTVTGNQMITIGGNENGHLRIDTQPYTEGADGLDGFGVLQNN